MESCCSFMTRYLIFAKKYEHNVLAFKIVQNKCISWKEIDDAYNYCTHFTRYKFESTIK